jgi:prephenate dehydrogenase
MRSIPGPIAIVGIGLMGGSLGLALRAAGVADVVGFDPDPTSRETARAIGAITRSVDTLADAVAGAMCVFVAPPLGTIVDVVREVLALTPPECVVSDLGSVKHAVIAALTVAERTRFIGGHPVCGGEQSGVDAARVDMFAGATWFLTPTTESRPDLYQRVYSVIAATGATPVAIDANVHDELMALVSHVPHILAAALVNQAAATAPSGREALRSAGPSFDDLTRVAGANPPLWADILRANASAVGEALAQYRERLVEIEQALQRDDRQALIEIVGAAAEGRRRLRAGRLAGASDGETWQITVAIPDQPGAVSQITTALGHGHINIADLVLLPGPPGGVGEFVVRVDGAEAANAAVECIRAIGLVAHAKVR